MTIAATAPDLGAVVLVLRGGAALRRSLDDVAWAGTRTVCDPAGLAADVALPVGVVRCGTTTAALDHVGASTVLLVTDAEVASPGLRTAAVALPPATSATVRCGWVCGDLRLVSRRRRVRIAPRASAAIALDRRLGVVLRSTAAPTAVDADLDTLLAPDVADATAALDGESRALAALLRATGYGPRTVAAARIATAAGWETWRAHAAKAPRPARWIVTMLATYRVVLAHARLWELAYAAGAV